MAPVAAFAVDVAGHDADLDFVGRNQAGAIGAEQQCLLAAPGLLGLHLVAHHEHVAHWNAFGNADRQIEIGFHSLPDRIRCACRRYVNHRNCCAGFGLGFLHGRINRDVKNLFAGLFRVHPGNETVFAIGVFLAFFGVELTGLAGNALGDDLGVFIDEDGHCYAS